LENFPSLWGDADELHPSQIVFGSGYRSDDSGLDHGNPSVDEQLDKIGRAGIDGPFQAEKKSAGAHIDDAAFSTIT
jgi:hypothetical protein